MTRWIRITDNNGTEGIMKVFSDKSNKDIFIDACTFQIVKNIDNPCWDTNINLRTLAKTLGFSTDECTKLYRRSINAVKKLMKEQEA